MAHRPYVTTHLTQPPRERWAPDPRLHAEALLRCYGLRQALAVARVNTTLASDDYWKHVLSALRLQAFHVPGVDRKRAPRRDRGGYGIPYGPRRKH